MNRLTKAIKYLTGKMTDALCPVCGRWMKMGDFYTKERIVHVWYCTNPLHDGTTDNIKKGGELK